MFDIAWRANRRNYALLIGSVEEPRKHTVQSWFFLGGVCAVLAVPDLRQRRPHAVRDRIEC